ncbi:MAG: IMP dehydrogenase [Chloroflexi bacterium]|nr:MAG: IMP dehydrogenase [Chloroflexota bacterium]
MKVRSTKGLTFDDVLLVPKRSPVSSRNDVDTSTQLTPSISLRIPIVSANMDTVTEYRMAIAMARAGGIGIIHRFMTIDQQVKQVSRVKRAEGFMVEQPYSISVKASVNEARRLMQQHDVGGLVVTNGQDELVGLVTQRDIVLAPDDTAPVASVMTPPDEIVSAPAGVSPDEARHLLHQHRLEKLPVLDDSGKLVGLVTAQDIVKFNRHPNATKDSKGRLRVGAAIGVKPTDMERAEALLAAGADLLVLDIAHGHADTCINMVKNLRATFPAAQIVAGNVASKDGAKELAQAGADAIKVGVGPGSICTTRIVTGFGVPQLTAIMDGVAGVAESGRDIPIIADGGIKASGDLVKALAAGAASVMMGSMFAGCEESPGSTVIRNGQKFKVVRGMASLGAAMGRKAVERGEDESAESPEDWDKVVPEGVEAVVPYRGHVGELLYQLVGGLRSGLSYGGAFTIKQLQQNAEFIEITPAGMRESHSHDVNRI